MPPYRYSALDTHDVTRKGLLTADSAKAARESIHGRGWTLLDLDDATASKPLIRLSLVWRRRVFSRNRENSPSTLSPGIEKSYRRNVTMKPAATLFLRELSTLLEVGLPVLPALDTLIKQQPVSTRAAWLVLRERVASGGSLARAMAEVSRPAREGGVGNRITRFDEVTLTMVEVGEDAGRLGPVLEETAAYRERLSSLRNRLGSALIYPAVVGMVGTIVCVFLMTYVVPQVTEPLLEAGIPPPRLTLWVMRASGLFTVHGWWLVPLIAVAVLGVAALLQTRQGAHAWHQVLLRIPLLGQVIVKQAVVRIAFVLSTLMRSGVSFESALAIARRSVKNTILQDAISRCEEAVRSGQDMGPALEDAKVFPATVVQVFTLGQASGNLESLLDRLAESYDRQVSTLVDRLTALLEPALILLLAASVGVIAFATILPILQVGKDL